jgi:large subunit ribosomal protein L9
MQIVLKQDVANLGKVGDIISVKPGYGRNHLLPLGMALLATEKNIAEFEKKRAELEKAAQEVHAFAKVRAEKITALDIVIPASAGDEGKLFGSIGPRDIATWITDMGKEAGFELAKKEVLMPEGPIRQVGEHTIHLKLHSEVTLVIKVKVISEK